MYSKKWLLLSPFMFWQPLPLNFRSTTKGILRNVTSINLVIASELLPEAFCEERCGRVSFQLPFVQSRLWINVLFFLRPWIPTKRSFIDPVRKRRSLEPKCEHIQLQWFVSNLMFQWNVCSLGNSDKSGAQVKYKTYFSDVIKHTLSCSTLFPPDRMLLLRYSCSNDEMSSSCRQPTRKNIAKPLCDVTDEMQHQMFQ